MHYIYTLIHHSKSDVFTVLKYVVENYELIEMTILKDITKKYFLEHFLILWLS